MLELKNCSNYILKDVSFVLNSDENLLILGENGAGKSTLAKVLSKLLPTSSLFYENKNTNFLKANERAKIFNYIPSHFEVFDEYLTLFEYLKLSIIKVSEFRVDWTFTLALKVFPIALLFIGVIV